MYTIFKNDTSIILTDEVNKIGSACHFLWRDIMKKDLLKNLFSSKCKTIYLIDKDLDTMWGEFRQFFKIIEASGGIVKNKFGEILFIFRHGVWDLPKGKIETGESRLEAGLREVKEECGIRSLSLEGFIGSTYHLYQEDESEVLKVSHWFEMTSDEKKLTPQLEEGITDLKWVGDEELGPILENTYPNIVLLLEMYKSHSQ